jgi:lipopolysaccharide export LptBFGC system permease protein LptF
LHGAVIAQTPGFLLPRLDRLFAEPLAVIAMLFLAAPLALVRVSIAALTILLYLEF